MTESKVAVSVCCITYNQERYVRQCLESLLMQKTDFNYEIIINDDASTDQTPQILKEYKEKYGDRIRLILQQENQYSQGVDPMIGIVLPCVRGKYIAFCEGDDYWTDSSKLQKQFDAMEDHPEASWCAHYVQCVREDGTELTGVTLPSRQCRFTDRQTMTSAQTIEFLVKNGIQMTSYFIRTERFSEFYTNPPAFALASPVEDEAIVRFCAAAGEMLFIPEVMTCYRMQANGSWTSSTTNDSEKFSRHYREMIKMISLYDEYTGKKYSAILAKDLVDKEWKAARAARDYRTLRKPEYASYRKSLPFRSRMKILVLALLKR